MLAAGALPRAAPPRLLAHKHRCQTAAQGDAEDRAKLRKKAEEDAKRRAQEERQELVLGEAEALARMVRGWCCCGLLLLLPRYVCCR